MAAAIGAGLPVHEPTGNMVVDIGGGTTEVAVISLGGIVTSMSIRTGGDELDQAIISFVKKEYSLMLGERTAEEIKMAIGLGLPDAGRAGRRDPRPGPRLGPAQDDRVSAEEIRKAIEEPVNSIIDAVKTTLDRCPPELSGDVMDRGIVLTGGARCSAVSTSGCATRRDAGDVADQPLDSVVLGTGKCVEEFEALKQVLISEPRGR
jgi:rod shape-determining protein MreB